MSHSESGQHSVPLKPIATEQETVLSVQKLNAWYGSSHILQGLDFSIQRGELLALLGRNGAGKTTTLKTIMGLVPRASGKLIRGDVDLMERPPHHRYKLGVAFVPEERRIVAGLTVLENLRLGLVADCKGLREAERIEAMAETFPRLKERFSQQAITLSGGEQQMLAIARALMDEPDIVLLDEPSEGIMPKLVDEMFSLFVALKRQRKTIILVEQNVSLALEIADRAIIIDQGEVVHRATATELLADKEIQERYCAV